MADRSNLNAIDAQIAKWLDQQRREGGLSKQERAQLEALRRDRAAEQERVDKSEARETRERDAEREAKAATEAAAAATEKLRAETEAKRLEAEAQKRKDDAAAAAEKRAADERQQAIKTGLNIAFPIAGAAVGHKVAAGVAKSEAASVAARAGNLTALAKDVEKQLKDFAKAKGAAKTAVKAQLSGSVRAADKLKLTQTKGPWAGIIAGMLVAEGAYSRFVAAPNTQNEIAKEALTQASAASMFAATTLIGERGLARSLPTAGPNAKELAQIEKARALTAPAKTVGGNLTKQALQLTAPAKKGLPAVSGGGLLGKVFAGAAVVLAVGSIVQSARAEGVSGALKTAAKIVDPTGLVAKMTDESPGNAAAEPSIQDLARDQAAARDGGKLEPIPNTVTAHVAEDVRTGLTPAGQGQLMARVANAGLDNFYAGPRPAEFERRASSLALAGVAAREVNSRAETNPRMNSVPEPDPAPSAHEPPKPRHVWDDYAREKAAEARRRNSSN